MVKGKEVGEPLEGDCGLWIVDCAVFHSFIHSFISECWAWFEIPLPFFLMPECSMSEVFTSFSLLLSLSFFFFLEGGLVMMRCFILRLRSEMGKFEFD